MSTPNEEKIIDDFRAGWKGLGWGIDIGYLPRRVPGHYYAALLPPGIIEQALLGEYQSRLEWYNELPSYKRPADEPQPRNTLPWDVLEARPEMVYAYHAKGVCLRAIARTEELYSLQGMMPTPQEVMTCATQTVESRS